MKPLVTIFFGLTGSGKSYLADGWAKKHNFSYFNTDILRKNLAGIQPQQRASAPVGEGIYSSEYSRLTYDHLIQMAIKSINSQKAEGVVLDGSYLDGKERQKIVSHLQSLCRIVFIYCHCSETLTRKRFALRRADADAISDGRLEIYLNQKSHFVKPETIEGAELYSIHTEADLEILMNQLDQIFF